MILYQKGVKIIVETLEEIKKTGKMAGKPIATIGSMHMCLYIESLDVLEGHKVNAIFSIKYKK